MPANSSGRDRQPGGSHRQKYRVVENLARELGLSEGQILRAWVVDVLSEQDSRIIINIKGKRTVARAKFDVEQGEDLIVQVRTVDPPIELKLYRAEDARNELGDEGLRQFLENMDFSSSQTLLDIARFLIDQRFPLSRDLIQKTRSVWSLLKHRDGSFREGRVRALRFLVNEQLPINSQLIRKLESLPESGPHARDWEIVESNLNSPETENGLDLSKQVQQLGIDLVRQIGKRPHSASQTLHARLLRTMDDSEESGSGHERLLSQILGIALASISESKSWVTVPFFINREAHLLVFVVDQQEERGAFTWNVRAQWSLPESGSVGFDLSIEPDGGELTITIADRPLADRVSKNITKLKQLLKQLDLDVSISVIHNEPDRLNPFKGLAGQTGGEAGKVDFTV